jgi:hypothetical protein
MESVLETKPSKPVATWRKGLAAVLDFITIFFLTGYAVGYVTGDLTPDGFNLTDIAALIMFGLIVAYFVIFTKYLGGTLWQRILCIR